MSTKTYYKHKIEKILVVSKIVNVGYYRFDKSFKTAGESHDFWELVYADQEDIVCTAGEKQVVLSPGEVIFHRPNEFHALCANGKKAPDIFVVSFECRSEAIDFFAHKKLSVPKELKHFIYDMIDEGKRTFEPPDPYTKKLELLASPTLGGLQLIRNYLELFLIHLIRALTETEEGNRTFLPKSKWENPLVQSVMDMLSERAETSVTMDEICGRVHYSKAYVCREFRETTGKSILQYYNEIKAESAKQLLRQTDLTVQEIAERLGFDNASYFGKMFRRVTGLTPTAYRTGKKEQSREGKSRLP